MNKELLKKISSQQTERFFFSYGSDWRLRQILMIEKQLHNRYDYFQDIVDQSKSPKHKASNDAIIAQEITNGLYFEAIAVAIQSIEDVFALLNAGQKPLKFIAGIITYSAGKVDNILKQKHNKEEVASLFYFPVFTDEYETEEQRKLVSDGLELLYTLVNELKFFYKQFRFFYNQYKHGLSVAFRAYTDYSDKQIEDHKTTPDTAHLQVFDNISVSKLDSQDIRVNKKILMPYLTEDISENMQQLLKDDNLIRFVTPDEKIDLKLLKSIVIKSRICVATFGNNLINTLKAEYPLHLQLPADLKDNAFILSFPKDTYQTAINKKIFI